MIFRSSIMEIFSDFYNIPKKERLVRRFWITTMLMTREKFKGIRLVTHSQDCHRHLEARRIICLANNPFRRIHPLVSFYSSSFYKPHPFSLPFYAKLVSRIPCLVAHIQPLSTHVPIINMYHPDVRSTC